MNHKMTPIPEHDRELTYNGVYTSEEAGDLLGVSPQTIRTWYHNGYIKGYEFGDRGYLRFTVDNLIPWLRGDPRSFKRFLKHTPKRPFLRKHKQTILEEEFDISEEVNK